MNTRTAQVCGGGEKLGSHGISLFGQSGEDSRQHASQSAFLLRDQAPAAVLSEPLERHGHIGTALSPGAPTLERKTHI